jgi:predicted PurR-regulated permease PerM
MRESPLYERVAGYLEGSAETYLEAAKHYATGAVEYVTAFGHLVIFAIIGLILAVLYRLEEEDLAVWARGVAPRSLGGTLLRWFGYLADAVALTVQLQLIVALFNAVFTLPILLLLGIPNPGLLALFIFATSLVPVVGNIVSGGVLMVLAHQARGWGGVAVFVVLTFILHKLESYYLNPRLTRRHVRLPSFLLIVSLLCWEHLLGIAGLFASFPFLFVATRIRAEMMDEDNDAVERATWANG